MEYAGKIAWQQGDRPEAFRICKDMERDFPGEWCVYHHIADHLLRDGQLEQVAAYYRKALVVQKAPRMTDPYEALAQYYERIEDYASAISVLQEELDTFEKEWHFSEGETADLVRREIERLAKKLS